MSEEYRNLSLEELVDVLAQKTQKFTQLLVEKSFNEAYKQSKEDIQRILTEIELRKDTAAKETTTGY
jgi:hypothetical protein